MKDDWLLDGRKIPDEVMNYFRKRAVQAIRENGQSPEVVARLLNLSETVPAPFSTFAPFSKALEVACIGDKPCMKVA